jgi:spermidine synthase
MEDYFLATVAQLYSIKLQPNQDHLKVLIVGLGGGVLPMYCRTWLKNVDIDAVEIDQKIVQAAKDWFDLAEDDKMRLHVADGLKFVHEAVQNGSKWDVVVIDINSSDPNSDLWGPTRDFIDEAFLSECKSIIADTGKNYKIKANFKIKLFQCEFNFCFRFDCFQYYLFERGSQTVDSRAVAYAMGEHIRK